MRNDEQPGLEQVFMNERFQNWRRRIGANT